MRTNKDKKIEALETVVKINWFNGLDDVAELKSENHNIRKELFDKQEEISKLKHAMWKQSHNSTERSLELGKQIHNLKVQLEATDQARRYYKFKATELEKEDATVNLLKETMEASKIRWRELADQACAKVNKLEAELEKAKGESYSQSVSLEIFREGTNELLAEQRALKSTIAALEADLEKLQGTDYIVISLEDACARLYGP
jgi:chromosome segregation ATPase